MKFYLRFVFPIGSLAVLLLWQMRNSGFVLLDKYMMLDRISYTKAPEEVLGTKVAEESQTVSNKIMVSVILSDGESGYTNFTSSLFRKVLNIPLESIHVFGKHSSSLSSRKVEAYYGQQAHYQTLKHTNLVESVVSILKYFQASNFDVLFTVTSDMVVSPKAFGFISSNIESANVLQLSRNQSECQHAGHHLCVDAMPRVFGSAMKRSFTETLLKTINTLRRLDDSDVSINKGSNITFLSSEESYILRLRQLFHDGGCEEYFTTYNFDRCSLPEWVQKRIEFYLDKCNRPASSYHDLQSKDVFFSKPIVSYSLYGGANPRYTDGALANSELMFSVYPDWKMWVYHDNSVPIEILQTLCRRGVKLINMFNSKIRNKMSWRFLVASEPVHRYVIRDIDSRLSMREKAAVEEWIKSGKKFHVMRDHPAHSLFAISGGMWGGTHEAVPNMRTLIENLNMPGAYLTDMNFLNGKIWPIAQESVWQNDAFPNGQYGEVHPFPTERIGYQHVGSVYIDNKQREYDVFLLKEALEKEKKPR